MKDGNKILCALYTLRDEYRNTGRKAKRKTKRAGKMYKMLKRRELDKRLAFYLFSMLILGLLVWIITIDYMSLPRGLTHIEKLQLKAIQNARFWEFNIGNGFVSRFEDMILYVSILFMMLRNIDLARILIDYERSNI